MEFSEKLEPLELSWSQKCAAYWSISWPPLVIAWTACALLTRDFSIDPLGQSSQVTSLLTILAAYALYPVFAQRLVQKNYRSFHVEVIRNGGERSRQLSMREAGLVCVRILWPQFVLLALAETVTWLVNVALPTGSPGSSSALWIFLRLFVFGPFGIDMALRAKYPGFRLQPYGLLLDKLPA